MTAPIINKHYLYSDSRLPIGFTALFQNRIFMVCARRKGSRTWTVEGIKYNPAQRFALLIPAPQKRILLTLLWWNIRQLFTFGKWIDVVEIPTYDFAPSYGYLQERMKDFKTDISKNIIH